MTTSIVLTGDLGPCPGDALVAGADGITIDLLPRDRTELPFKTLLRYADGREDAWIELPTDANPDPEQPAPTITVAAAPAVPTTTPSSSAAPSPAVSPSAGADTTSSTQQEAAAATTQDSSSTGWIVAGVVVVAVALAGVLWFRRGRASRQRP